MALPKIESDSSFAIRFIGLIGFFDLLIFVGAYVFSRDLLTWKNFLDNLCWISFLLLIISLLTPGNIRGHGLLGYNFTPVKLDGSREIIISFRVASILGLILSFAISLLMFGF